MSAEQVGPGQAGAQPVGAGPPTPGASEGARPPGRERPGRHRDAAASKQALLRAAQTLFGKKGFERTTIREIGELAGVDAALIARYFGNKAELYIAAVVAEDAGARGPAEFHGLPQIADILVARSDARGPGPIIQALIRSDTSPEIQAAARDRLARRVVVPLAADLADRDLDRARLRAEVAVCALYGITLGRSLGWFDEISSVPRAELVALVTESLTVLAGSRADGGEGDDSDDGDDRGGAEDGAEDGGAVPGGEPAPGDGAPGGGYE